LTRRDLFRLSSAAFIGSASSFASTCASPLDPQTAADYDAYMQKTREQIEVPLDPEHLPEAGAEPHVWNVNASPPHGVLDVRKGVIIHWCGAVRIKVPNIEALSQVLSRYDMYTTWYRPYIAACRATQTGSGQYRVITILHDIVEKPGPFLSALHFSFEVESAAVFRTIGNTSNPTLLVTNRAEKIRESDGGHPEKADSRKENDLMRPDYGHGALWRSDTQWRAIHAGDTLYAEYQSISLARSVESISLASLCAVLKLPGIKQKALNAMTERPRKLVATIARQTREACEKA
jgi:hypothetical protein